MDAYIVKLEVFEGPLDLLLTLVQRSSLDISTVALARVTDQYLVYLAALEEIDLGALAEFCEVASTLLLLKSRALLPRPAVTALEEEGNAEALAEQLRAYRRFKEVADTLGQRERAGLRAYARVAPQPVVATRLEPGAVGPDALAKALQAALAEAAALQAVVSEEHAPLVARPRVTIGDRIRALHQRLVEGGGRLSFREALLGERLDREFIIVSFLAVLELLRRRAIKAVQEELFGDILLESLSPPSALEGADMPIFLDEPAVPS